MSHAQFIIFNVGSKPVGFGLEESEQQPHTLKAECVCVCACAQGPEPNRCTRGGEERSQTCARGQGQGSQYTNIPREIKCENAPGPVGPLGEHSHSEYHGGFPHRLLSARSSPRPPPDGLDSAV